jgi:NAD(P)-dependent dehydrogenase (short-subunit alcohol dehydrogenase family)
MNEDGGQQTVHLITENDGEAIFMPTDVTQAAAVEALISKAAATYGGLDCAHNNAGISGTGIAGAQRALTADYPEETMKSQPSTNENPPVVSDDHRADSGPCFLTG